MNENLGPYGLSIDEIALLEFTNEGIVERPEYESFTRREPLILTMKSSYLWPITIAIAISKNRELEENTVIKAYREALQQNLMSIRDYYGSYIAHMGYHPPFEGGNFYNIHESFLQYLRIEEGILDAQTRSEIAYQSLVKKGLIEDPVFTIAFGIPLAVVGFIPYSFTQRTRRGRTVYRKIEALFWKYEKSEDHEQSKIEVHFRLWKILKAFKNALAEEMEDAVEEPKEGKRSPG